MRKILLFFAAALSILSGGRRVHASSFAAERRPELASDYYLLYDRAHDLVLWEKDSEQRIYPASITKLMTAAVVLDRVTDYDETIEITEEMVEGLKEANATRAGFWIGDTPTIRDLLYGDLLASGAECSRALAYHLCGSEAGFVELMNRKAKTLGMEDTHFANTSGLHDDDHYTTCRDLLKLYRYCLELKSFEPIIQTEAYISSPTGNYPDGLEMRNSVLIYVNQDEPLYENYMIEGFKGGKSGYTQTAQYTLASECIVNSMDLILINCHAYKAPHYPSSIEDAAVTYNWFREHYDYHTVIEEGEILKEVPIRNSLDEPLAIHAEEKVEGFLPIDENLHLVIHVPDKLTAPVKQGELIGTLEVYRYNELFYQSEIRAEEAKAYSRIGAAKTFVTENPQLLAAVLVLVLPVILLRYLHR